jgi:glycosyltransferase involved in cell wall biosynthesis
MAARDDNRATFAPRALEFLIPGDLRAASGGYVYDRRMIAELRALGWRVTVHALDASFPHPTLPALAHAHRLLASMPAHALVLIDGLALSAMPEVSRAHSTRLELLALIHMPLAAEVGIAPELARCLQHSELRALHTVRHVIVTSHSTRQMLLACGLESEQISVIEPGTDEAPLASRGRDALVKMLCVATINPGKGHDLLVEALAPLTPLPWHLTCVGSTTRYPAAVAQLRTGLQQLGLSERVTLVGEIEAAALSGFFLNADLFVLPTRFESYGMAVAEALAHGLPVVSTRTGAIPALVGSQAGLLVEPGDLDALHDVLARVLSEPTLLANLATGAAAIRSRLPRWEAASARLALVLERIQAGRAPM